MKKYIPILALLILSPYIAICQENKKDSIVPRTMITMSYTFQVPGGDMSKRFLSNSAIGGGFLYKTRHNFLLGVDGYFMFRDTIKETSILDSIKTSNGNIIDGNGEYVDVRILERGFNFGLKAGKLFPVSSSNKNSGILVLCGVGFMQHKIRIENKNNSAPQISGDYRKGYDRLTNGLSVSEFVGYMHMGESRLVNFYAGFEFTQAWTQNRRSYNFDLRGADNTKRMDLLSGFRIGWVIPLNKREPEKFYYN